jgi:NAD kinase
MLIALSSASARERTAVADALHDAWREQQRNDKEELRLISFDEMLALQPTSDLSRVALLIAVGGDGAVAFVVREFFSKRGASFEGFPPLCLVSRRSSVGFLRQLDLEPREKLFQGVQKLLKREFQVRQRCVLRVVVPGACTDGENGSSCAPPREFAAVNEVCLRSDPVLGMFDVCYDADGSDTSSTSGNTQVVEQKKPFGVVPARTHRHDNSGMRSGGGGTPGITPSALVPEFCGGRLAHQWGDGVLISTAIGSTGWAHSYGGDLNLNEDSLGLLFVGGIDRPHNLTLPRRRLHVSVHLKNASVTDDTVAAFRQAAAEHHGPLLLADGSSVSDGNGADSTARRFLDIAFGTSRLVVDGKIVAFDVESAIIDCSESLPFVTFPDQSSEEKVLQMSRPHAKF